MIRTQTHDIVQLHVEGQSRLLDFQRILALSNVTHASSAQKTLAVRPANVKDQTCEQARVKHR